MFKFKSIALLSLMGLVMFSCESDPKEEDLKTPTTYEFNRDGESTVSFGGQTTRIKMAMELSSALGDPTSDMETSMEMFRNESITGDDVSPFEDESLNESTKSIRSKVAASKELFAANATESTLIKEQLDTWITEQYTVTFANKDQIAEPGQAGQLPDGSKVRYVNDKGMELNQFVAKSLIGSLMVDQINNNYLSTQVLDESNNRDANNDEILIDGKPYTTMEHKWDEAYGYLFGNSSDPSSPLDDLGSADPFLNKYLSKVDADSDFEGIAQTVFDAFARGRAAIVAEDYSERDKQVKIIRDALSKVVAVRAVHYLQGGKEALLTNNYGKVFHELSEGYGFIYSLRFAKDGTTNEEMFSKEEIDGFMEVVRTGNGFWSVDEVKLEKVSADIAAKFDFTVEEAAN